MIKYFIVLLLVIISLPTAAAASWYIVDEENKVIAIIDYAPSLSDLAERNELAIWSDDNIAIQDAEYAGNKIRKRVKSAKELSNEAAREEKRVEEQYIREEMRQMAIERLKEKGHTFKHVK